LTVPARLDQPSLTQHAQVGARVLERGGRLLGQLLDRLFTLAQEVQQLQSLRGRDGMTQPGELSVGLSLNAGLIAAPSLIFVRILDYVPAVKLWPNEAQTGLEPLRLPCPQDYCVAERPGYLPGSALPLPLK
jgi:hypothetical protein